MICYSCYGENHDSLQTLINLLNFRQQFLLPPPIGQITPNSIACCARSSCCRTVGNGIVVLGDYGTVCGYCQDCNTLSLSDGKVQITTVMLRQGTLSCVTKLASLSSIPLDFPCLRIHSQSLWPIAWWQSVAQSGCCRELGVLASSCCHPIVQLLHCWPTGLVVRSPGTKLASAQQLLLSLGPVLKSETGGEKFFEVAKWSLEIKCSTEAIFFTGNAQFTRETCLVFWLW